MERISEEPSAAHVVISECNVYDDEDHRLNHCKRFKDMNYYDHVDKIVFDDVHSENIDTLNEIIEKLQKVWNTKNAAGTMNREHENIAN